MRKITKIVSCFLLTIATLFAIVGCGKSKKTTTKRTTTKVATTTTVKTTTATTTTTKAKTSASVTLNNNIEGVTINAYKINGKKKEAIDLTKEVDLNTKLLVEVINKSSKNISVKASLEGGNDKTIEVESKTKATFDEMNLTNNLNVKTEESDLLFVRLENDDSVTFSGYYYDDSNNEVKFDSTTLVAKNTKVYLKATIDTSRSVTGIVKRGDTYVDSFYSVGKLGHDPVVESFDSEGIVVTDNIKVSYTNAASGDFFLNNNVSSASVTCKDVKTNTTIDPTSLFTSFRYEAAMFAEISVEVSNPDAKKLAIFYGAAGTIEEKYITEATSYTFNFISSGNINVFIYEYGEYTLSIKTPNSDDIDAQVYYYDEDGIEFEAKNGDKFEAGTTVQFAVKNNSIYDCLLKLYDNQGHDSELTLHAKESIDSKTSMMPISMLSNMSLEVEVTDTVTKFYKATFENKTDANIIKFSYWRGMYDYPEVGFNNDVVSGTKMAVVVDNNTNKKYMVYIYNTDTEALIESEDVNALEDCAVTFDMNSNVKVVLDYLND